MQDDTLQGSLTVRENLMFSANLRLPSSLNYQQRVDKVNEVIEVLGLTKSADTSVGDVFRRGVSGGERRRTSVGMELLTMPAILFLDEPTSGLDSLSALRICKLLQDLAKNLRLTIICTIHQPSSTVFECFDKLLLLSRGQMVYFGERAGATQYFADLGKEIPSNTNPADFYGK